MATFMQNKVRTIVFNRGKVTGNMVEYKQCSYSFCKASKQESQFNGSDTRHMWQGLQTVTDYKRKTSHITDTDVLLPDKLNTFTRFEDNTVPPTRSTPKDCGISFSVAEVSKTFKSVKSPQSMRRPAGWSVYRHIQSLPIPVCCPHLLQDGHHCSCTQESKGN